MREIKIALGLLIASVTACASASNDSFTANPDWSDKVWLSNFEQYFQAVALSDNIPGAALIIVNRDRVLHQSNYGYAVPSDTRPVSTDTVFRIASVSKTFAATLAGLLVAEGKLSWDEPITRYAPQFRIKGATERIHLDNVLGQSTGLPAYAYDNFIEEGVAFADIVAKFSTLAPVCRPGECYTYQNSAFSLIQPALEHASQHSYADLLRQRIFQPLEMNSASVGFQDFLASDNRAQPHVKRRGKWKATDVLPNYYRVAPAAGVNASANDLAKWLMAQLGARPDIIPTEVVADVTRPRVHTSRDTRRKHWRNLLSDAHYALGWRVYNINGEELIYHGGWVAGFRTDIAYSPTRNLGMAMLMNAEGSTVTEVSTAFWAEAFSRDLPEPTSRTLVSQDNGANHSGDSSVEKETQTAQ